MGFDVDVRDPVGFDAGSGWAWFWRVMCKVKGGAR